MEPVNQLKMLWHGSFWDQPLNGLAEYNGEKVFFVVDSGEMVDQDSYPTEVKVAIARHKISKDKKDLEVEDYDIYYDESEEVEDGRYSVLEDTFYKIYRIPSNILKEYEDRNTEFCEMVGYHCWHDPSKYKPFVITKTFSEYYAKKEGPIEGFDIKNFECLGRFKYSKFQWYSRPF